jgi:peptide deformylase
MAIREVRTIGDEVLGKISKPVKAVDERTLQIIEDMFETMYETGGVGIAAPQVGILKRIVCMDVGDGNQYLMINPEIIELSGEQTGMEGCLSVPGKRGQVTRANYAKVKAYNENMEEIIIEGEGLLARCIQHECDHLDGILYVTKVEGELVDKEVEEDEDEE